MIFTKIASVALLALLGAMCWLAIRGFTPALALVVTAVALLVLIGGGSMIGGRSSSGGRGRSTGEPEGPGRS